jgi:hypothetical protein
MPPVAGDHARLSRRPYSAQQGAAVSGRSAHRRGDRGGDARRGRRSRDRSGRFIPRGEGGLAANPPLPRRTSSDPRRRSSSRSASASSMRSRRATTPPLAPAAADHGNRRPTGEVGSASAAQGFYAQCPTCVPRRRADATLVGLGDGGAKSRYLGRVRDGRRASLCRRSGRERPPCGHDLVAGEAPLGVLVLHECGAWERGVRA